jgi:hypothetical protein
MILETNPPPSKILVSQSAKVLNFFYSNCA